ncbi:HdeD family acid-resistance protein [Hyphomicrobium sp.]|uniref:HdeD family acid-resistance protein n=1 Tax=Hyphomicrobium sp. TaxID=82 RepID=UPI001D6B1658|nr:HdeD family acid-resistance protein [Hyphomicrobium sp.]MBY0558925.1 HdeD family acid-resistance protein [Hyphomicrobium sp.]
MTARPMPETRSEAADPSWWGAILVGAIFIFAGIFVLGDVVAATVISAFLIGILLAVAGVAEVFQAFSAQHWRGFAFRILVGLLYVVCGLMLIADPARASIIITFVFAVSLIASGFVRIFQAFQYWEWFGSLLLISGIVGIVAGLVILAQWPVSGLWVLGLLVGIDLLLHGVWWISLGGRLRRERNSVPA